MGKGSNTVTTAPDPQMKAKYMSLVNRAEQVSKSPYVPYKGQMVAPQGALEQQANAQVGEAGQSYKPYFDQASQYAQQSTRDITPQAWSPEAIRQYQNPYQADVVNATMANVQQTDASQRAALTGNAISKGAFGGDRGGIAQAELARQQNLASNQTFADLNAKNYDQANAMWSQQQGVDVAAQQASRQNEAQAAGMYGNLGVSANRSALDRVAAMSQMGMQERAVRQAQDQANYQKYQTKQQYPFQTMGWLGNLLQGVGSQTGGTTSYPEPSFLSQIGGLALGGMGMAGSMGWKPFAKDGGRVQYGDGGRVGYATGGVPMMAVPGPYGATPMPYDQNLFSPVLAPGGPVPEAASADPFAVVGATDPRGGMPIITGQNHGNVVPYSAPAAPGGFAPIAPTAPVTPSGGGAVGLSGLSSYAPTVPPALQPAAPYFGPGGSSIPVGSVVPTTGPGGVPVGPIPSAPMSSWDLMVNGGLGGVGSGAIAVPAAPTGPGGATGPASPLYSGAPAAAVAASPNVDPTTTGSTPAAAASKGMFGLGRDKWADIAALGFGMAASNSPFPLQAMGQGGQQMMAFDERQRATELDARKQAADEAYRKSMTELEQRKADQEAENYKLAAEKFTRGDWGIVGEDPYGNKKYGYPGEQKPGAAAADDAADKPPEPVGSIYENLKKTKPSMAAEVDAMLDGRTPPPTARSMAIPHTRQLIEAATDKTAAAGDPTEFDLTKWGTRYATRKAFAPDGKYGVAIGNGRTAIGHLGAVDKQIDHIGILDTKIPFANYYANVVKNAAVKGTGSPEAVALAELDNAKGRFAEEATKFYRGIGGSEADIERTLKDIDNATSPAELHAAVHQQMDLIRTKIQTMGNQYQEIMGVPADGKDIKIMDDEAQTNAAYIDARYAIAKGADRAKVIERLTKAGLDPGQL